MALDLSVDLIKATVQIEQPLPGGARTVGAGFLVQAPTPDGKPRVVLVTAAHVFDKMPADTATVGYRVQLKTGEWRFDPKPLTIRVSGKAGWTRHPSRDVAVMTVIAPPEFAKAAIPLSWLASDDTFNRWGLGPGDEMMALGFPRGLSANKAGFPILRAGRVASYPLAPSNVFPTFLLDFSVFPGNSGGPVFMSQTRGGEPAQFIAGILTQQVELNSERLEIGIVTHARFIRETLAMLDGVTPAAQIADGGISGPVAVSVEAALAEP